MAPELGQIGPFVIRTYTLFLDAAILLGLGILVWQGHHRDRRAAAWLDAGIATVLGGLIIGRIGHVMIYWAYFTHHVAQAFEIWRGGIDWHAAILGGIVGLALMCQIRRMRFRAVTDVLAFVLPIGALLTYTGCWMVSCGHGREVTSLADYPSVVAAELPDIYGVVAPRLASQLYGVAWSIMLLLAAYLLARSIKRSGVRAWVVLALLGIGAFVIGYTRGDDIQQVGALRLDQVLDLAIAALGLLGAFLAALPGKQYRLYGPAGFVRR